MLSITCPIGKDNRYDGELLLISFSLNRYIVDHLLRTMRHFELDMDSVIVWSLLAHLNVVQLIPPGATPEAVLDADGRLVREDAGMQHVRLRDLEQISMLPRETVRRKLVKLEERGLVCRHDDGWAMCNLYVDEHIREFMRESGVRVAALCNELNRIRDLDLQRADTEAIAWRLQPIVAAKAPSGSQT